MDSMMDVVVLDTVRRQAEERRQSMITHMYMIDDMMDEIMMLDDPNAIKEIAAFVKTVVAQMEEI